jgi:hypothetical protein
MAGMTLDQMLRSSSGSSAPATSNSRSDTTPQGARDWIGRISEGNYRYRQSQRAAQRKQQRK